MAAGRSNGRYDGGGRRRLRPLFCKTAPKGDPGRLGAVLGVELGEVELT